jgi:hypothetical protein
MNIKEAMACYFVKLNNLYKNTFGTFPTVSWSPEQNQDLFIGKPDEDGEIQWKPVEATPVRIDGLRRELQAFYGSYYYWELRGEYKGVLFDFPPLPSLNVAESVVCAAINDGEYYFPNQETVLLATCSSNGNDDLLLFFRQNTGELFIYDSDKRFLHPLNYSLVELICSMKAVI